ncbi:hypothetical protein Sjap_024652 [Stephania japonica]|uniref:Fe2OG dioxygenase domain-containing protein n=1 Tax=Stephania japonica TaxID=461633 RepID=A0AAP0EFZ1_9MAGN
MDGHETETCNDDNNKKNNNSYYDRAKEVKDFDDSKIGVKGLVDSGITAIPRFFHHPPETAAVAGAGAADASISIPTIDLSGDPGAVSAEIRSAAQTLGFFQIINHGVPSGLQSDLISAIKSFNDLPAGAKSEFYTRDFAASGGVSFATNFDLLRSKAASWRDTIQIRTSAVEWGRVPGEVRREVEEWDGMMVGVGRRVMGAMGLGECGCLEGRLVAGHYYPWCPEADRTVGIASHTDPAVLTVLLQDGVGGLQVKHGDGWVDVVPLPGALVINVGDILQILSNDEYKSVEHRVLANRFREPRISIAIFFNPGDREALCGPLPEFITPEKPALYRQFKFSEFLRRFVTKELDGKTLINYFRL